MAEKQYKNYDERFLKEDSSSGGQPVISYIAFNADEVLHESSGDVIFAKAKFKDGSYCQTSEDLINLFQSGFIFAFENPGVYTIYSNQMMLTVPNTEASTISVTIGVSAYVYMVDAPTFEQLKQSKS